MSQAIPASDTPYAVEVGAGKSYFWCSCGKSVKQPFCDDSHGGSGFTPVKYMATVAKKVYFCGCKAMISQPMCDGSHKSV